MAHGDEAAEPELADHDGQAKPRSDRSLVSVGSGLHSLYIGTGIPPPDNSSQSPTNFEGRRTGRHTSHVLVALLRLDSAVPGEADGVKLTGG